MLPCFRRFVQSFKPQIMRLWTSNLTGQTMTEIRIDGSNSAFQCQEYLTPLYDGAILGKFIFQHIPMAHSNLSPKLWEIRTATVDALRESQRSWQSHWLGTCPLRALPKKQQSENAQSWHLLGLLGHTLHVSAIAQTSCRSSTGWTGCPLHPWHLPCIALPCSSPSI